LELFYFLIASFLVVIVPGPTVSLIVANSIKYGVKAGLLNVLGTQFGVLILIFLLAIGFEFISPFLNQIIKIVRILGAVYLITLGVIALKSKINLNNNQSKKYSKRFFFQGLIVILTNPKIFFFLGSFLPQFISLDNSVSYQIIYFGLLFILVATICDSCYALIFGKFRDLIVNKYLKILNLIGGSILILVGGWLFFY
jgi:threonine/homoserine/homoserine lactone efflux protein